MLKESASRLSGVVPLLLGVAASRLLFALIIWKIKGPAAFFTPDSQGYVLLAHSLANGSFSVAGTPEIFRTPGYPLFLLPSIFFNHWLAIAIVENVLLAVATAWLIWRIAEDLCPGSKAAWWAVLLYCFEPVGLLYSGKVMSETLFVMQMTLAAWLLINFFREPKFRMLLFCALVLGLATYTRPVSIYLGIGMIPVLLLFAGPGPLRRRTRFALAFGVVFALVLSPWVIRNEVAAKYGGVSTAGIWQYYFMSSAAIEARLEHKSFSQVMKEWGSADSERYFQMHPEQRGWSQAQMAEFWGSEAKRIISRHPGSYAVIHARGCAIVLFDTEVTEILKLLRLYPDEGGLLYRALDQGYLPATLWLFRGYPLAMVLLPLGLAQILFYYAFAIAGLHPLSGRIKWFFIVLFGYFVLVSGIPSATGRLRAPIMPFVCILAGVGIANRLGRSRWHASAATFS